jgi:hypothetical protein
MDTRTRTASGAAAHVGLARRGRAWPLRSYLVGLLVLFVLAAGAGVWSSWVQARHDALSQAKDDAMFAARRAALQISESLTVVRGTVARVLDPRTGSSATAARPGPPRPPGHRHDDAHGAMASRRPSRTPPPPTGTPP